MALNLRQKQTESILQMLNLNPPVNPADDGGVSNQTVQKILIYDRFCRDVLSPLILVKDLRKHGVTLYLLVDKDRNPVAGGVPAVYFLQPTPANVHRIISDAASSLYGTFHLNFSSTIPSPLLQDLAAGALKSDSVHRISKIQDQHLEFITLEDNLFSLGKKNSYVQLNDPSARDKDIHGLINGIVNGLFSVLATLTVVPIIRCPRGGIAELVASLLDQLLHGHLLSKDNFLTEGGKKISHSVERPVLCLFDRNFEFPTAVQHDFRYRPLVHDVLGLKLNQVSIQENDKKSYQLDSSDPFWVANGSLEFPDVAQEIENQLNKYKEDIKEIHMKTDFEVNNTKDLMSAVNSLPELTERKNVIDKHTNIATALLREIRERCLDSYAIKENEMMMMVSVNRVDHKVVEVLKGKNNGSKMDKLRLAILHLLLTQNIPPSEVDMMELVLKQSEIDTSAFRYVKNKIKSSKSALTNLANNMSDNIVDWAGKLYEKIENILLYSGNHMALVRTMEALTEGNPNVPHIETCLTFDPCASHNSSRSCHPDGPFKEAIVFMIGGGNYVEYENLVGLARRQQPARNIIYGATEILTGEEFVEQLAVLGRKMGL
ncbi:OLC1v1031438C1 [Oldenlandia corymbosa var. corymbosa]|uniref:OLC1v1031438C1 n=1 Tax=Oldenlandia corymbosa var. corymbosa TaxID=529605 RepID=A0AAV1CJA8_OLDCO|nr:OLC1v1031438C1 [Oldenlandia corymbosa var. corymbosa]